MTLSIKNLAKYLHIIAQPNHDELPYNDLLGSV